MNERMRELALQANIHFSRLGMLDGDPDGIAKFVSYSKMEKFAELIVRECMDIAREEEDHSPFEGPVETKIKQHFGVEE